MTEPISYLTDNAATRDRARPPRSAGTWLTLVLVWGAGLLVWALYISAILYAFFRVML